MRVHALLHIFGLGQIDFSLMDLPYTQRHAIEPIFAIRHDSRKRGQLKASLRDARTAIYRDDISRGGVTKYRHDTRRRTK